MTRYRDCEDCEVIARAYGPSRRCINHFQDGGTARQASTARKILAGTRPTESDDLRAEASRLLALADRLEAEVAFGTGRFELRETPE